MDEAQKWETEALRESRRSRASRPIVSQSERAPQRKAGDWVTLREASEATGIPVGTLRKWARRESVPSYLESDGELSLRMVSLGAVRDRARTLGRTGDVPAEAEPERSAEPAEGPLDEDRGGGSEANREAESPDRDPETETDVMIVPIDAWNKMLMQLGNLHEAGQQLAEARERAAKAETEASFLRERLTDLRSSSTQEGAPDATEAQPAHLNDIPEPQDAGSGESTSFWRYVARGWRRRRR